MANFEIDDHMPRFDVRERHQTTVRASPERVYQAIRRLDMSSSPTISWLFRLRQLPAVLSGRGPVRPALNLAGLEQAGFVVLEERPGEEVLLGIVGRFWSPAADVQRVTKHEFLNFDRPGYAYAVWNFRIRRRRNGILLTTETRVRCTTPRAGRRFRIYWTLIGPFSGLIRREMLRLIKREAERSSSVV